MSWSRAAGSLCWPRSLRTLVFSALLALAHAAHADPQVATIAAPQVREAPWVRTGDDDGIASFTRDIPGSPIVALRGEGIVDAPIARVASVLFDYRRATEWIDSLEEARLVRMLGEHEFVEYDRAETPPIIMKDRDFVCHGRVDVDLVEQSLTMSLTPASDPAVPKTSKYVRGELSGFWKLKSIEGGKKTFVIAEMHGDPKGSVPKWLVNLFQKSWARSTINALRKQVAKPDIRVLPAVTAVFAGQALHLDNGAK